MGDSVCCSDGKVSSQCDSGWRNIYEDSSGCVYIFTSASAPTRVGAVAWGVTHGAPSVMERSPVPKAWTLDPWALTPRVLALARGDARTAEEAGCLLAAVAAEDCEGEGAAAVPCARLCRAGVWHLHGESVAPGCPAEK